MIDDLLSRLDGVKKTGHGKWLAKCCAHDDRSPSLALAEGDDGRVLVKCFAGCSVENVLGAVGLTFDALFPPKAIDHHVKPMRHRFNARDVLEAMHFQATVVALAASDLAKGIPLSTDEKNKLFAIAGEFGEALDAIG